jgi:hypothetical protein
MVIPKCPSSSQRTNATRVKNVCFAVHLGLGLRRRIAATTIHIGMRAITDPVYANWKMSRNGWRDMIGWLGEVAITAGGNSGQGAADAVPKWDPGVRFQGS